MKSLLLRLCPMLFSPIVFCPMLCMSGVCELAKESGYAGLRNEQVFVYHSVDIDGVKSKWFVDYECILHEADREAVLETLLTNATMAGQLHALQGLKEIGSDKFERNILRYESDESEIEVVMGCFIHHDKVSLVAGMIKTMNERFTN